MTSREVGSHAQNDNKMKEEEEFIGSLANRAQTCNDEEAENTDGNDSNLNELGVERSRFHAEEK